MGSQWVSKIVSPHTIRLHRRLFPFSTRSRGHHDSQLSTRARAEQQSAEHAEAEHGLKNLATVLDVETDW
jgi:hypothetical protein